MNDFTVCFLSGLDLIPGCGEVFLWKIALCQPILSHRGRKLLNLINGTTQPAGNREEMPKLNRGQTIADKKETARLFPWPMAMWGKWLLERHLVSAITVYLRWGTTLRHRLHLPQF